MIHDVSLETILFVIIVASANLSQYKIQAYIHCRRGMGQCADGNDVHTRGRYPGLVIQCDAHDHPLPYLTCPVRFLYFGSFFKTYKSHLGQTD